MPKKILPDQDSHEMSELLSFPEEALVRLRDGVSVDPHQPLERKTKNKVLLSQLEQLERQIIARAQALGVAPRK